MPTTALDDEKAVLIHDAPHKHTIDSAIFARVAKLLTCVTCLLLVSWAAVFVIGCILVHKVKTAYLKPTRPGRVHNVVF